MKKSVLILSVFAFLFINKQSLAFETIESEAAPLDAISADASTQLNPQGDDLVSGVFSARVVGTARVLCSPSTPGCQEKQLAEVVFQIGCADRMGPVSSQAVSQPDGTTDLYVSAYQLESKPGIKCAAYKNVLYRLQIGNQPVNAEKIRLHVLSKQRLFDNSLTKGAKILDEDLSLATIMPIDATVVSTPCLKPGLSCVETSSLRLKIQLGCANRPGPVLWDKIQQPNGHIDVYLTASEITNAKTRVAHCKTAPVHVMYLPLGTGFVKNAYVNVLGGR